MASLTVPVPWHGLDFDFGRALLVNELWPHKPYHFGKEMGGVTLWHFVRHETNLAHKLKGEISSIEQIHL